METIVNVLARYFTNLGAGEAQAQTMAAQLIKRAEQIAADEAISTEAALTRLLNRINSAREDGASPDAAI